MADEEIVRYGAGGVPYVGPKTAVEPAPEPEEKEEELSLEENQEWDSETGSFKEKE